MIVEAKMATEDVILHLVYAKCMPALLSGLECFELTTAEINSLDFTFRRFMFKLFITSDIHVVNYCASTFAAKLLSELLGIRRAKFLSKFDSIGLSC